MIVRVRVRVCVGVHSSIQPVAISTIKPGLRGFRLHITGAIGWIQQQASLLLHFASFVGGHIRINQHPNNMANATNWVTVPLSNEAFSLLNQ